jgi:uroporphyrinogen decarboxylase
MPITPPDPDLLARTAGLDTAAFWEENARCQAVTRDKPRCALAFSPDDHWIFEAAAVPSTLRYYQDKPYRDALHREVNAHTLEHIGRAFFNEDTWEHQPRRIENLFGCHFTYHEGGTPWLTPVTDDPAEFAAVLDRAEAVDIAAWALPDAYRAEWAAREAAGKPLPSLGTGSRGPATIITSVLTPETAIYWMLDHPDLMHRFRDLLAAKMIELNTVLRTFSGNTELGWWITDDNSALFNRPLYREYCVPVLRRVLDAMAPPPARRYQHSDSAMGHLLDIQYDLGIREVNYGPTVDAALIREKMPDAHIFGQMPPFLLRNGTPEEIRDRVISDFHKASVVDAAGAGGAGEAVIGALTIATAGSLAAGTGVDRMRWLMHCVQHHTRYDN